MKEKVIYFTKITSISIFSFLKINLIGALSTVIVAVIGFILLSKNITSGQSGHISAIPYLVMIFTAKPVSSILFYLIVIASPFLFFIFGNKYISGKIIHKILDDKSENYLTPILDKLHVKIKENEDNLIKNSKNYDKLKSFIIQQLKNENKWIKRIVTKALKKVKLDDIDFKNKNLPLTEIFKTRIVNSIKEFTMPSKKGIWALIISQWIILILIWILPY